MAIETIKPAASIDPVTHEIIQGKLLSIVDEMAIVMTKTSMSPVIYEVLDFACGICNAKGELIAQTNGIKLFAGTFGAQIRSVIDRFGASIFPGDVIVTNDPFRGGTHAPDMAVGDLHAQLDRRAQGLSRSHGLLRHEIFRPRRIGEPSNISRAMTYG